MIRALFIGNYIQLLIKQNVELVLFLLKGACFSTHIRHGNHFNAIADGDVVEKLEFFLCNYVP